MLNPSNYRNIDPEIFSFLEQLHHLNVEIMHGLYIKQDIVWYNSGNRIWVMAQQTGLPPDQPDPKAHTSNTINK